MPWSGGVYTRDNSAFQGTMVWTQDAAALTPITAAHHDFHDQDIANGLNNCVTKDGTNTATSLNLVATVNPTTGVIIIGSVTFANMIGTANVFVGNAGNFSLSGVQNSAFGYGALPIVSSGSSNVVIGYGAALASTTSGSNVIIGTSAATTMNGVGSNVIIGTNAAQDITSGNSNIAIGFNATGTSGITTGSQNIVIGTSCQVPSGTANGQLSLGNIVYGFANTATGSSVSTGRIAIGQSTDDGSTKLQINGQTKSTTYVAVTNAKGTVGASTAISWNAGQLCTMTLTSATALNITSMGVPGFPTANPGICVLLITAPAAGSVSTVTFPATVFGTPAVPTILSKRGMTVFYCDGTNFIVVGSQNNY